MDALILSRLQFAWVIALHILLPAFTVGLACYVATLETMWWLTQRDVWRRLSAFWIKIFAVAFGMGVVSGIVMPFQFGTNWSRFVDAASNVVCGLMAYEGLTAFFLEAAVLGVLLFGRQRVPQWAHVLSAVMVALGTLLSSFWILAVNSWMQTPQGYEVVDGLHGLNTLEHQPAKLAAMEGLWTTRSHVQASLFAVPDAAAETNRFEIAIPDLASLYLTHSLDIEVKGLKDFPREDRPPVAVVYFAFRIMVGLGLLMLLVVLLGWFALRRGGVDDERSTWLKLAQACMPIGFLAVVAGWTTTEVGRQPWVVYGLMRTRDAVSPSLTTGDVALSLAAYIVTYLVIFGGGFVLLRRMFVRGPEAVLAREHYEEIEARAARPLSAASDAYLQ